MAKTTTCHHDIAGAKVTTTTVPGDLVRDLGEGDRVTHRGDQAALVGDIDVDNVAPQSAGDLFGLRNRTPQPGPVYLDEKPLAFNAESKAAAVTDLPEPAGQYLRREHAHPHVLDRKLLVRDMAVGGDAHIGDHNWPPIRGLRAGAGSGPTPFPRIGLQCNHSFYTGQPPGNSRVTLCHHTANAVRASSAGRPPACCCCWPWRWGARRRRSRKHHPRSNPRARPIRRRYRRTRRAWCVRWTASRSWPYSTAAQHNW